MLQRGNSLVEISVVLVIIATLISAATLGSGLVREAEGVKLFVSFVRSWEDAFHKYTQIVGAVPGDNPLNPVHIIYGDGGAPALCNSNGAPYMTNLFLARGVILPESGQVGREDRLIYQDSEGAPHELQVCFRTIPWSGAGASAGTYRIENRHVLELRGLTTELASQMDVLVDGRADARFGRFRSATLADRADSVSVSWISPTGGGGLTSEVSAFLLM